MLFQVGQDNGLMKFTYNENGNTEIYKKFSSEITEVNCFITTDSMIVIGTNYGMYHQI